MERTSGAQADFLKRSGAPGGAGRNGAAEPARDDLDALLQRDVARAPRPEVGPGMTADELLTALLEEPWAFDFFQAVRRLECAHADRPRVGASSWASEDAVRFAQEPSLAFAPSSIARFKPASSTAPPRLFVNFMGLLGPNGPLPLHLTEFARERERHHRDPTLARFLDMFNHRMISLLYRAWSASRQTVSFDRALRGQAGATGEPREAHGQHAAARERLRAKLRDDRYSVYIGSLFGLGMDAVRERDALPDVVKMHYSGRLASEVRNAEGVCSAIRAFFGIPVRMEEFVGRWLELPQRYWCQLGGSRESAMLGVNAIAGGRVWECQSMFRLRLGPLKLRDYERLLPGGATEQRLAAWIRNYVGDQFSWEAVLVLDQSEVPRLSLGHGAKLGWTTWLSTNDLGRDAQDLVLKSVV